MSTESTKLLVDLSSPDAVLPLEFNGSVKTLELALLLLLLLKLLKVYLLSSPSIMPPLTLSLPTLLESGPPYKEALKPLLLLPLL